jgi:hypothetical protein
MRTIITALLVLAAAAAWGVTEEELAAQAAVVAAEQGALDSLTSQSYADALQATVAADSALTANEVRVLVYAPEIGTRDAQYVYVDVQRDDMGPIAQIRWDIEVSTYPAEAAAIRGRYLVHRLKAALVLEDTRAFLIATNLEE